MAGRGPTPKETRSRGRDQRRRDDETTHVEADGRLRGPELPELPEGNEWPDATRDWWQTWRLSAQAATFAETDWSFLLDTAILHMAFWDGDLSVASELRLRAAKFGATPEDRARLKLAIGKPEAVEPAKRTRTPASRTRRERLLKAVGDDG